MRVCGVHISGKKATLALVTIADGGPAYVDVRTRKFELGDHTNSDDLTALQRSIIDFARANDVELFAIKSRATKGHLAGGGITFKIEVLFQLSGYKVVFVNPVAIAKFVKKSNFAGVPVSVRAYQHDAYLAATYLIDRSIEA